MVVAHFRMSGMSIFPYLDDWLLKARSPEMMLRYLKSMASLLFDNDFSISVPKSRMEPSQILLFIGTVLNTSAPCASPPYLDDSGYSEYDSNV